MREAKNKSEGIHMKKTDTKMRVMAAIMAACMLFVVVAGILVYFVH